MLTDKQIEDNKNAILMHLDLLKGILKEGGMAIAFDKSKNDLVFLDRELYIKENKMKGFSIPFDNLTY